MNQKLIILRGPSASGKSTIAKSLVKQSSRKIALLEEDYFRRQILRSKDDTREACKQMLGHNAQVALKQGYDVVLEGILNLKHYRPVIEHLLDAGAENYIFYFDISFEETLRRHQNKPIAKEVSESELAQWFTAAAPFGHEHEMLIPDSYTLEHAIQHIRRVTGI